MPHANAINAHGCLKPLIEHGTEVTMTMALTMALTTSNTV